MAITKRLRVAFTSAYPTDLLRPELRLVRRRIKRPNSWVLALSEQLAKRSDIDLHILCVDSAIKGSQIIRRDNITYHVVDIGIPFINRSLILGTQYTLFAYPVIKLIRELRRVAPDVVHGHGSEGPHSLAAVLSGYPTVLSMQGIISEIVKVEPTIKFRIGAYLERFTINRSTAINVKSVFSQQFVEALTSDNTPMYFIEPAIDDVFFSASRPKLAQNLFFVGSLLQRKGVEDWIDVFKRLARVFLDMQGYIVGEGGDDYVTHLRGIVAEAGVADRIHFLGLQTHHEIQQLYSKGGVYCLPTYADNSPNSLMEAMSAGLPVVATNIGAISSLISDGANGFVVKEGDIDAIFKAVKIIFDNKEFADEAGKLSRSIALDRWRSSEIAKQHVDMYREVLSRVLC